MKQTAKYSTEQRKIINVRVNPDQFIKLKLIAINKSTSATKIIESLIDEYIAKHDEYYTNNLLK